MNFNSEKIGYKNSSAHELLAKKYATFLLFLTKNDVKFSNQSKRLTSFFAMKRKKCGIFFRWKFVRTWVLITNFFRIENHLSRAKLWRFFHFQAITLIMQYENKANDGSKLDLGFTEKLQRAL